MKVAKFDRDDPRNMGRPSFFDLDAFLVTVEGFITADEVDSAMWLLDNMPGWFRDNEPIECRRIRRRLLERFFTTLDYGKDGCTIAQVASQPEEQLKAGAGLERGALALEAIKSYGEHWPWIYELGPGNYWIPFMLKAWGCEFLYYAPSLNQSMQKEAAAHLPDEWMTPQKAGEERRPRVFICFEMLEHLARPEEIYHHYIKAGGDFDTILLSTPKYTFGGGMPNWYESDLGHLRTYTPREFLAFAQKQWPEHEWQYIDGQVMCLRGEKK